MSEGPYRVQRVVDGDTLLLDNQWRVRLIGADTPETVHPERPVEPWGPEATEFTRQCLAEALAEKVARGELREDHAMRIGRQIMRENALKLFQSDEPLKFPEYIKRAIGA